VHKGLEVKQYLVKAYPPQIRHLAQGTWSLGLYNIFVYVEAVAHESAILSSPTPTCIAHPAAVLMHDYWTVEDSPSDLPCML